MHFQVSENKTKITEKEWEIWLSHEKRDIKLCSNLAVSPKEEHNLLAVFGKLMNKNMFTIWLDLKNGKIYEEDYDI